MERARLLKRTAAFLVPGLGLAAAALFLPPEGSLPDPTVVPLPAPAPPARGAVTGHNAAVSAQPPMRHADGYLGRGGTLSDALDRLGVPPDLRSRLLAAIESEVDVRRLPSDTALRASIDEHGAWRVLGVRTQPERFLRVRIPAAAGTGQPFVEWVEIETRTELRSVGGVVETSVAQALAAHPQGTRLTVDFADIFQWDVDLLVEPRRGDRVSLVYELRRLGEVPPDAPPLRGRVGMSGDLLEPGRIVAAAYSGSVARADAFWVATHDGSGDYFDRDGRPLRKTFLKSPLNYRRISSGFSRARRNPVTRQVVPHHGVDYAAAAGTPVVASADGRVISAGWDGPLGRAVRIRHGSEYVTIYGHLRGFARGLRAGVQVRQNEVIGYVGSTGRATGPHLHYTVVHRGTAIDPMRMDNPPVEALPAADRPTLDRAVVRYAELLGLGSEGSSELAWRRGLSAPVAAATGG